MGRRRRDKRERRWMGRRRKRALSQVGRLKGGGKSFCELVLAVIRVESQKKRSLTVVLAAGASNDWFLL